MNTIKSLLFYLLTIIGISAIAQQHDSNCAASPEAIEIIQLDNSVIRVKGNGNMRHNHAETEDGYTIVKNKLGIYEYAILKDDQLVPSGVRAADVSSGRLDNSSFLMTIPKHLFSPAPVSEEAAMDNTFFSPNATNGFPTSGTRRVLVLLIQYPDLMSTYTQTNFTNFMNETNYNGTGSFKDYYLKVSDNQLTLNTDVFGWYTAVNNYAYYGNQNGTNRSRELVREAIDAAEAAGVNFANYDNDGNGSVDGIIVVHSGPGAEFGSQNQYIWSHRQILNSYSRTYDGVSISDYMINPETRPYGMVGIGVFAHEFGHGLGLPDLYDTDTGTRGIGYWCLMSAGSWLNNERTPGFMSAWSRIRLGWVSPTVVSSSNSFTLNPSTSNTTVYRINTPIAQEYFLLENRQKIGQDAYLPGSGLAIWHIDDTRNTNRDADRKWVDLEEADGARHLDFNNEGDAGDLFPGSSGNTVFDRYSTPNSNNYDNGNTYIRIHNISQNGNNVSFNIEKGSAATDAEIASFSFVQQSNPASIDFVNKVINISVVPGTNLTSLVPTISLAANATISPASGVAQDFTNLVTYRVTAADGQTIQDWVVSVTPITLTEGDAELFGVNLSGAEFGNTFPGVYNTDYTYPTNAELDYFKSKGLKLIRFPFRWERVQHTLGGALNTTEINRMKAFVEEARSREMMVILDMHNWGRYKLNGTDQIVGSPSVTVNHLKDVWIRLAQEFSSYWNIWGYDFMNQPHDMLQSASWFSIAQEVIYGIRTVDTETSIIVQGDIWSGASYWPETNDNLKNLVDPNNRLIYAASVFFDDGSSLYAKSYDEEGAHPYTGEERVAPFVEWIKKNNKKGFISSYGVPNDDPRWLVVMDNFLSYLKTNCVNATYWVAGPWWGTNKLSIEPNASGDRPQMSIAKNYTMTNSSCNSNIILAGNLDFGGVTIGETGYKDITITNFGSSDLVLSGLIVPAGIGSSFTSLTIPTNQSATIEFSFTPSVAGAQSGKVSFESSAGGTIELSYRGTGTSNERGYYSAPYKRYEADLGTLTNGASATTKSYAQNQTQSEASNQQGVNMNTTNATVEFTLTEEADGLVIRYSVPENQTAVVGVYHGNTYITSLTLTSFWSWEHLWSNGNPNNSGVSNQNPKMRFDEIRYKLPSKIGANEKLKLVRESGNILLDFIELESIPASVSAPANAAIYTGNGSNLQAFIDANGGKVIYLPQGVYSVNRELYFGVANTTLQGAGMWYTQINFTATATNQGGLRANSTNISFLDLYLTTSNNSRSNAYKGINGVFTSGSVIKNIWAEHFECGAWIGQYNQGGPAIADGFTMSHCRFRNNYADGVNLCKGTSNAIVEHCNFRNNGDDDQAIWSADGLECINNTFRYNTSEHCWRASGVAIYGGKNNKAHHLLIRDNVEVGIRVNNSFPGVGFNDVGVHEFEDITIKGCGTFNDLYNQQVGAIDVFSTGTAGTRVKNVKFKNIDIIDSKNDAIMIAKKGGEGIYDLSFESINVNGTGKEYPNNNVNNLNWGRGYFVLFVNYPSGNATYCDMNYQNRGGNAGIDVETYGLGQFSWTQQCMGPRISLAGNLNFGEVLIGSSDSKNVVVTNSGSEDLIITRLNLPDGVSSSFSGATIPFNQTATITLNFSPTQPISYSGSIGFVSNASSGNNQIAFSGTGTAPVAIINPTGNLAYGNVYVEQSKSLEITVANSGTKNLVISSLTLPDGLSSTYSGGTIAPQDNVKIIISFNPTEAKAYTGNVTINSDADSGNNSLVFTGTGILSGPRISLMGSLDYGNVIIDSNSAKNLTISNTGNESMSITSISFPTGFTSTFASGNVAANGQQIISVVFAPTDEQTYSGNITISSNAIAGTGSIAVQGVGIQPLSVSEEMSFTVYPIPFADKLVVESNGISSIQKLEIFDMEGKRVFHIISEMKLHKQLEIDLSDLKSGIYILTIKIDDKNKAESYRILKN